MENQDIIYTEEIIILIKPLKAKIFKDGFQIIESHTEDGDKIIILRSKEINNPSKNT